MNWLDFLLLAVLVISVLVGMRIGLLGGAFAVGGVVIGWMLAGQFSDDVGGLMGDNLAGGTLATVAAYVIIISASSFAAGVALKLARPFLTVFSAGLSSLVDRVGGLVMGLLIGVALVGALIIGLARLSYNFDPDAVAAAPTRVLSKVEDTRESLEESLIGSRIVSIFVDVSDALPGEALGFAPGDFTLALDILRASIEAE